MLDLLKKKGNYTIFASLQRKKSVEQLGGNHTTDLCLCCCFVVVAKTVFLLMLLIIIFFSDVRCALHACILHIVQYRMSPQVNMSSEPTFLNNMPLVVSSEFGKSAQFNY